MLFYVVGHSSAYGGSCPPGNINVPSSQYIPNIHVAMVPACSDEATEDPTASIVHVKSA